MSYHAYQSPIYIVGTIHSRLPGYGATGVILMRGILASAFVGLLLVMSIDPALAQDRPIDLSSKGAKVFKGAGGQG